MKSERPCKAAKQREEKIRVSRYGRVGSTFPTLGEWSKIRIRGQSAVPYIPGALNQA